LLGLRKFLPLIACPQSREDPEMRVQTARYGGYEGRNIFVGKFEVFMAVTMKNGVFWDVSRVDLVRTDVSEELSASIIKVTRIDELGT
jgi:hypothetical protein